LDIAYYTFEAYCGNNMIAKIWRFISDIHFNIFIKHRNPLTPIVIGDLNLKPEEEKAIKEVIGKALDALMERY
jgi:hypothetical protein